MKKSFVNLKESSGLTSLLYSDTTTARLSKSTAIAQKPIKFTLYLEPSLAERVELLASLKGISKSRFLSNVISTSLYTESYEEQVKKMQKARQ